MNTIVTIEPFARYKEVNFYTVKVEDKEKSETEEFLDRYENDPTFEEEISELMEIITSWGREGIPHYFRKRLRSENAAKALPPKGIRRKSAGNLVRLYCYLIRDNIMILGNGGHKKSPESSHQESPELKPHFDFFNRISDELDRMIIEKDLIISDNELEGEMEIWLN